MANERITEDIVREHFKKDPLFAMIKMDEQKSSSKKVLDLLQAASKSGKGAGKPEFLISFPSQNSKYLIVIECKYNASDHQSKKNDDANKYAVDGVLHYAKFLSQEYEIIAIGVSGHDNESLRISTYKWGQGQKSYEDKGIDGLLSINDYIKLFNNEAFAENLKNIDIIQKAVYLNNEFQACSISEYMRCTIVSAILLSLLNGPFKAAYPTYKNSSELGKGLVMGIDSVLQDKKVREPDSMVKEYQKILNEPLFTHQSIKKDKDQIPTITILKEIIDYIQKNVLPLMQMEDSGMDVLGKFYTEFVRYAGGSSKVGLVLTPVHIANLFCDLADLTTESVVYDPCTGSGGFLVSAMKKMLSLTQNDNIKKDIKEHQLIGVESRADMFTYACSNMMFRGDGRSNIYHGDCYQKETEILKNHQPTVSFLNPPYDVGCAGQMGFIDHALRVVSKSNGIVIAIVQMSCAIKDEKELVAIKEKMLERHTLKAVISMPDELFNPAATVPTCIMIWEANRPNRDHETRFGYLKDDGFEKIKHKGRVDAKKKRDSIKQEFIKAYKNSKEIAGLSVKKNITANDERLCEAYMDTDYSKSLGKNLFCTKIRNYISFDILDPGKYTDYSPKSLNDDEKTLNFSTRKPFRYDEVFDIQKGYYNKKPEHLDTGTIPFIGATEYNNGVTDYFTFDEIDNTNKAEGSNSDPIEKKIFEKNCITVSNNGSVGYAFYQKNNFTCSHDVNPLYLKNHTLNIYIAIFLATLIEQEQYRRNYGRKRRPSRMPDSIIKLPIDKNSNPDREFMEKYVKSLPYSASL